MRKAITIAECCQNHNGSREILKRMIHEAADTGAEYVKIQAIRSRDLAHRERFDEGVTDENGIVQVIKRPYAPELERLATLDLSLDDELWFVEECRRAGVGSMTTVFTRTALQEVKEMGFEAVKVASYDCASFQLLKELRQNWSTLIVSTGATFNEEIEQAASILNGADYHFLHCVTIYPTPLSELHFRRMDFLRKFTPNIGFSDHTKPADTGLWASKIALALGASCIERHYTILPKDQTKDGPVSINPTELKELVDFARLDRQERMAIVNREFPTWEQTLGQYNRSLSHAELLNRDYYRGRFASKVNGKVVYNWEDEAI